MGRPAADLLGKRFGVLTVVSRGKQRHRTTKSAYWLCRCSCGVEREIAGYHLRRGQKSCGCMTGDFIAAAQTTHGHCVENSTSPTYRSWVSMIERCSKPDYPGWEYYGALGVTVCRRWLSFKNFLADMGVRPLGKTLDRYPNPWGNYEPSNCRWATNLEQRHNRRDSNADAI